MLKPREIEALPLAMVELYSELEEEILADMARRIAGFDTWIASADWQYQKMIEAGNFHSYIVEALAARTGKSRRDLERLMQEAGAKSLAFDTAIYREAGLTPPPLAESAALRKALKAGYRATRQTMQNLTRSTAKTATGQFERALDLAWLQIQSGAFSPEVAVQSAIKRLAKEGVQSIRYPSGRTDSLEVAVRRATLTGVNQTCLQMQLALAEDLGSDLVETTAHAGARPSHAAWQGKVFSLSGKSRRYPDFRAVTGYGTGAGLGGWNCSHSFSPYFEGMPRAHSKQQLADYEAKKYQYKGQKLTEYEALQEQRSIERNIRRWKREFAAMDAAGLDKTQAAAKLSKWQGEQRAFLEETGLRRQAGRESVAGWGRSEAARARKMLENRDSRAILQRARNAKDVDDIFDLGKIDTNYIEKEFGRLNTSDVIITKERISHIRERHPEDYTLFEQYGMLAIQEPTLVLRDSKNAGTVFMVKQLPDTNLNVVLRLSIEADDEGWKKNSVMTFYRVRNKNLAKLEKKHKVIYKRE